MMLPVGVYRMIPYAPTQANEDSPGASVLLSGVNFRGAKAPGLPSR